jgi:hypothetical protein
LVSALTSHNNPVLILLLALMPVDSRASQSTTPQIPLKDEALSVRLLVPSPRVCMGRSTLDLEAVLTNSTNENVVLSSDGVVHIVSFRKYLGDKPEDGAGWLIDFEPKHWITIPPHQSVVVPFTEPIKEKQFGTEKLFSTAGVFSVQIEFAVILKNFEQYARFPGSARSNEALFTLSDCRSDPTMQDSPR